MQRESIRKILVTGSRGFVGSHLVKALDADGLDREMNILSPLDFTGYETVIHCAAEVGRIHGEDDPRTMLETNILGTLNVIRACIASGSRLINFSTSEVSFPLTNIYGISKDCAERLVKHYVDNYGLKAVNVRPMMLYGPGSALPLENIRYKSALDQFIYYSLRGQKYEVHGGSSRGWLHISDFVNAIREIIKTDFQYTTYDIGSDDYRSMEAFAKIIGGTYTITDSPRFLTPKKTADYSSIRNIGWEPKIDIETGIKELIQWHESLL